VEKLGEKMYRVKRALLIIKLKQPYLDWTKSLSDPGEFTLDGLNEESHVYLIPDHDTRQQFEEIMRDLYEAVFEIELNAWCSDSALWPKKRDYQTFRKWFDLQVHSIVFDPYEDEIEEEEF
jgi:hypothetical protein